MANKDVLEEFMQRWVKTREFKPPHDENVTTFSSGVQGVTVYRDGPFQVQLFLVSPFTEIPDHVHPLVDSYEYYLAGEIQFRLYGEPITKISEITNINGVCSHTGTTIRVLPTAPHGGTFGALGGAFFSIQHWLNGNPTSVELDWGFTNDSDTEKNFKIANI